MNFQMPIKPTIPFFFMLAAPFHRIIGQCFRRTRVKARKVSKSNEKMALKKVRWCSAHSLRMMGSGPRVSNITATHGGNPSSHLSLFLSLEFEFRDLCFSDDVRTVGSRQSRLLSVKYFESCSLPTNHATVQYKYKAKASPVRCRLGTETSQRPRIK